MKLRATSSAPQLDALQRPKSDASVSKAPRWSRRQPCVRSGCWAMVSVGDSIIRRTFGGGCKSSARASTMAASGASGRAPAAAGPSPALGSAPSTSPGVGSARSRPGSTASASAAKSSRGLSGAKGSGEASASAASASTSAKRSSALPRTPSSSPPGAGDAVRDRRGEAIALSSAPSERGESGPPPAHGESSRSCSSSSRTGVGGRDARGSAGRPSPSSPPSHSALGAHSASGTPARGSRTAGAGREDASVSARRRFCPTAGAWRRGSQSSGQMSESVVVSPMWGAWCGR
mmetsp:Transcript_42773/g.127851  ORF Transcript_42773/g.127851 Transcript_42773/m.127851 type:complete len:290 (-) Transcript_42773:543-1412(-)